jgi:hypothetical protein
MDPIRRTGPPVPTDVRSGQYDLTVPLSAAPSRDWRRSFETPDEWKDPCHPSRIKVKGRSLVFTSDEHQVGLWIQWIDRWIAAANRQTVDVPDPSTRQQAAQDEQARERLQRLREATERFNTH